MDKFDQFHRKQNVPGLELLHQPQQANYDHAIIALQEDVKQLRMELASVKRMVEERTVDGQLRKNTYEENVDLHHKPAQPYSDIDYSEQQMRKNLYEEEMDLHHKPAQPYSEPNYREQMRKNLYEEEVELRHKTAQPYGEPYHHEKQVHKDLYENDVDLRHSHKPIQPHNEVDYRERKQRVVSPPLTNEQKYPPMKGRPPLTAANKIPVKSVHELFAKKSVDEGARNAFPDAPSNFLSQLKNLFPFATVIGGTDKRVSDDRLFLIFGRSWKKDLDLAVTRVVVSGAGSNAARDAFCKVFLPPVSAICLLPDPDWLCNVRVWDALDDYHLMVQHFRKQLPNVHIIHATYPIEKGTDYDPKFFQFNFQIKHDYDKPNEKSQVFETERLLSRSEKVSHEDRKHYLSDTLTKQLLQELSIRLADLSTSSYRRDH